MAALDYLFIVPFKLTRINHSACHSLSLQPAEHTGPKNTAKTQGKNKQAKLKSIFCDVYIRVEIIKPGVQLELKYTAERRSGVSHRAQLAHSIQYETFAIKRNSTHPTLKNI